MLRKDPIFTRISDPNGEIAKLNLMRSEVRPGESVYGLLDFRDGVATCTEFCVSLLALESVAKPVSAGKPDERVVHASCCEVVLGMDTTSFELHVPETVAPTFKTSICMKVI